MINERETEREEKALSEQLSNGLISQDEYNREMQEIQRSYADAYEEDRDAALRAVDEEWSIRR